MDLFKKKGLREGVVDKVEKHVVENIDDPISIIYLKSLSRRNLLGDRIHVNKLMEQGLAYKNDHIRRVVR